MLNFLPFRVPQSQEYQVVAGSGVQALARLPTPSATEPSYTHVLLRLGSPRFVQQLLPAKIEVDLAAELQDADMEAVVSPLLEIPLTREEVADVYARASGGHGSEGEGKYDGPTCA